MEKKLDSETEGDLDGGVSDDIQDDEDKRKGIGFNRRRRKLNDALFSCDDFQEIDNVTGLLGLFF